MQLSLLNSQNLLEMHPKPAQQSESSGDESKRAQQSESSGDASKHAQHAPPGRDQPAETTHDISHENAGSISPEYPNDISPMPESSPGLTSSREQVKCCIKQGVSMWSNVQMQELCTCEKRDL